MSVPATTITVADVLAAGACYDETAKWLLRHSGQISISVDAAARLREPARAWVLRAGRLDGDGSGYGDGYGSGYGDGDGDGYGDGDGDGDGSGYGDGDGDGYGYGDGDGDGYGDGDGDGYGDGDGEQ